MPVSVQPRQFDPRKLRAAREARRLSREQLAITIGRSCSAINSYELAGKYPSLRTMLALAAALGVAVDDLTSANVSRPSPRQRG